jgi:hypothetical protein
LRWIPSIPFLLPLVLLAQDPGAEVKEMRAVRTTIAPTIDGVLSEEIWATAGMVEDLHQVRPNEYSEPTERNTV